MSPWSSESAQWSSPFLNLLLGCLAVALLSGLAFTIIPFGLIVPWVVRGVFYALTGPHMFIVGRRLESLDAERDLERRQYESRPGPLTSPSLDHSLPSLDHWLLVAGTRRRTRGGARHASRTLTSVDV